MIGVIITPEITLPGYEGIIYGAITTYSNQAQNLANAANNLLLAIWPTNADNEALRACALPGEAPLTPPPPKAASPPRTLPLPQASCAEVQANMSRLTLLAVAIACTSLFALPLIPSQKAHIKELALKPKSKLAGNFLAVLLVALLVLGTGLAVLPIFPQTACLRLAGGVGCT